jgi:NADPH2:quinone reductase
VVQRPEGPDGVAIVDAPEPQDDHVVGFGFGCLAEQVVLPARSTFAKPAGIGFTAAGGFVMSHPTAHVALHRRGELRSGETVLVHGAGGGLDSAVVQMAARAGAEVLATASTPQKRDLAARCGAAEVFDSAEGWVAAVRGRTRGRGVDVVADVGGGDVFDASVRVFARQGPLLVLGFTSGQIPGASEPAAAAQRERRRGRLGALLEDDPLLSEEVAADLDRLHHAGSVAPEIREERPLEESAEALRALEARTVVGKIVARVCPDPVPAGGTP